MRFLLFISLFLIGFSFHTQAQTYKTKRTVIVIRKSPKDSARVMEKTKTTTACAYMTDFERDILQWLNIARMYPKWFIYFRKLKNEGDHYSTTLFKKLNTMKPSIKKLEPDSLLWYSASCHVKTSGPLGYVGHVRQHPTYKRRGAECCHYGTTKDAAGVIQAFLIDRGVPSYGHRKICLDPTTRIVGISKGVHKEYGHMYVIDIR